MSPEGFRSPDGSVHVPHTAKLGVLSFAAGALGQLAVHLFTRRSEDRVAGLVAGFRERAAEAFRAGEGDRAIRTVAAFVRECAELSGRWGELWRTSSGPRLARLARGQTFRTPPPDASKRMAVLFERAARAVIDAELARKRIEYTKAADLLGVAVQAAFEDLEQAAVSRFNEAERRAGLRPVGPVRTASEPNQETA